MIILLLKNILINEIQVEGATVNDDWVELYNTDGNSVDISGWILDDSGTSSDMLTIPQESTMSAQGFKLFYVGNRLNQDGDTVTLLNSNRSQQDSQNYGSGIDNGKSLGRYGDGSSNWQTLQNPTPGSSNSSGNPLTNPSPSPSPLEGEGRGEGARVILWPGFCHVHTHFTIEHVHAARKAYPGCKIIVHPECKAEVVMASDEAACTEGICKFVKAQASGSIVVIGTEINLVMRLMHENPDEIIVPLARSLCPNMFKISLNDLCWTLEQLVKGETVNEIIVPDEIAVPARIALERMLLAI